MAKGLAYRTYDPEARAWYLGLNEHSAPPYWTQSKWKLSLISIAMVGWPGVEIIGQRPDGSPIQAPLSTTEWGQKRPPT